MLRGPSSPPIASMAMRINDSRWVYGDYQFPVASFAPVAGKSRDARSREQINRPIVFSDKSNW